MATAQPHQLSPSQIAGTRSAGWLGGDVSVCVCVRVRVRHPSRAEQARTNARRAAESSFGTMGGDSELRQLADGLTLAVIDVAVPRGAQPHAQEADMHDHLAETQIRSPGKRHTKLSDLQVGMCLVASHATGK